MAFSAVDHAHMARALRLAARGLYTTAPNPRVGCVLTHGSTIVGEGFHARSGEPHAEVFALRAAGERARDATAYVTLEPCAHHGRTPPCADDLIAAGVVRVVAAIEDPFPAVAGRGFARLREAGLAVESGLMREAAWELNRGFFARTGRGRPWLRAKLATSLDGRTALANGRSQWITGEAARTDVQRWRARSSAILTGAGTVRADDPRLTVRLPDDEAFAPPLRIVLDTGLAMPAGSHVLDGTAPTLVMHAPDARRAAHFANVELAAVPAGERGRLDLDAVLRSLAARDVNEVQLEAGPTLAGAFLAAGLVDELLLYLAPSLLGDAARPLAVLPALAAMAERRQLRTFDCRAVGDDLRLLLRPEPSSA